MNIKERSMRVPMNPTRDDTYGDGEHKGYPFTPIAK